MSEVLDHIATDSGFAIRLRYGSSDDVSLERAVSVPRHIAEMLIRADEPEATRALVLVNFGAVVTNYELKYFKEGVNGKSLPCYRFEADERGLILVGKSTVETFIY